MTDSLIQEGIILQTVNPIIIHVSTAIVILLLGLMIGKLAGLILKKLLLEVEADKNLKKISPIKMSITNVLSLGISLPIYVISFFLALNQLGIANIVLNLIIGFIIMVVVGAIILGLGDAPKNILAGFWIKKKNIIGKTMKIGIVRGEILKKTMLKVEMKTKQNDRIIIPNYYFKEHFKQ